MIALPPSRPSIRGAYSVAHRVKMNMSSCGAYFLAIIICTMAAIVESFEGLAARSCQPEIVKLEIGRVVR